MTTKNDNEKSEKKVKLAEHTAIKNMDKVQEKNRVSIWVKRSTLEYEEELRNLQTELIKVQNHVKSCGLRILVLFEGRDAAGKGGTIKRFTEHINPRGVRVVALEMPSDREQTQWYFQRYVQHLPSAGEIVLFDRSWYNRAMVEPVMGFCTDEQNKRFLKDVPLFEQLLVKDGIFLFKFYFSVSKDEQTRRFDARKTNPLKQYKVSRVDKMAQEMWDQYTIKKFQMLSETNRTIAPWIIIRSNNKRKARLNCIKYILYNLDYEGKVHEKKLEPDPEIVISGIDELKHMEDNLLKPIELPG
ncbi:MAG: polyphosphate kinase 2 [Methanophagales archaeon]|jgi:polyphosphate kinase 2|nr:polyphosphate kinase 2 [Methanophagales archaeon]